VNAALRRSCRPDGAGEFDGVVGYKDFAPDGAFGRSATVSTVAADVSRLKVLWGMIGADSRPLLQARGEFGERFPRVGAGGPSGADRLSGADRQPGADGFESRWDSRTERKFYDEGELFPPSDSGFGFNQSHGSGAILNASKIRSPPPRLLSACPITVRSLTSCSRTTAFSSFTR
jgi:hypothetical protein